MNNFEQFNILVDEYLEQDKTYELQIKNFKNFLIKKNLQNQVFNLERKNIDVSIFVDDIVSLDDVQKSFERLTSGDDDAIKILIDPTK